MTPGQGKRSRATPKRQRRQAAEGSRFLSEVLASNIRMRRRMQDLTQEQLAEQMERLGHPWSAGVVGFVERNDRTVSVDELIALALVLHVTVPQLLDPAGIDGTPTGRVDYGSPNYQLPSAVVVDWLRGAIRLGLRRPQERAGSRAAWLDDFYLYPVEGEDEAAARAAALLTKTPEDRPKKKERK